MAMWICFLYGLFAGMASSKPLTLQVNNIKEAKGAVMVAIYNQEKGFLALDKMAYQQVSKVTGTGTATIIFPDLPEGAYAISCFHDVNGNNELDKNMFGIPTEPYGFSMGARPKFRAPTWAECKFWFNGNAVQVKLETW